MAYELERNGLTADQQAVFFENSRLSVRNGFYSRYASHLQQLAKHIIEDSFGWYTEDDKENAETRLKNMYAETPLGFQSHLGHGRVVLTAHVFHPITGGTIEHSDSTVGWTARSISFPDDTELIARPSGHKNID